MIGQIVFVAGLLVAGAAVMIVGGTLLLDSAGLGSPSGRHPASSCPMRNACTTKTIDEVSAESGYTFPNGSSVIWAYEETSWFDHSWAMRALVRLPAGSALPANDAVNTTATPTKDDAAGVEIEVSVLAPDGR
ncbi:hypothetical protein [Leifsonia aquatica]|uniref:Uncharacterized protein n=2 Tax=Leifsonia aquatica TaxID=144185 RepID=A0A7W4UUR6_LEIAQ|nr:hypothetical protein [Leifsonia aquatica]MBB2966670.1 hypothetical protein [Leifsonia aquatica]